ncbi:MAG: ATP-binding protein [Anaerolineae bacterium]|nr:ATP-binding protein [Anaerolineae bacterium]MDW8101108.1 ATP-binding protein [Anaerolineae bacterium]
MVAIEHGLDINLRGLRFQLTQRLALALMGVGFLLMLLIWPVVSSSFIIAVPAAVLFVALGWGVWTLAHVCPVMAQCLLVGVLTGGVLVAMGLSTAPWIPFLGLIASFISAMLISRSEFITAGAIAVLAVWLTYTRGYPYPLPELLIALALGTALAWQAVCTMYTALEWAWTMQQRAEALLELARDRQSELSRVLKSLDLANMLLRRTQQELIAARQQAEEARRMKEQFAANVSHELRTPLSIILGFSEVMYLSPEVYGDVLWPLTLRQDIYQIYRSSRHLLEMINDVLDLSRFEMVGFALDKEPTSLEQLVRDAVSIAEGLVRGRPIRLEVEIPSDLPVLEVDRVRIRQVLLNLLNNAIRFTEKGFIRVKAIRAGNEVWISVRDTGPGIPAQELPHLFEEFYQVDRSWTRKHGGAGLGLAICKRFVEAHDGRIWVESVEGHGATFTFALPIPEEYVPVSRLQASRFPDPLWPKPRPSLLVVDPDSAVGEMVRRHMSGFEVVQIEDTARLDEKIRLYHPCAVIRNVRPGEQVAWNSSLSASVPLIECSLPSHAWMANDLAVKTCLTKPFSMERLLQEVQQFERASKILVIDDDRDFCRLVERMLEASEKSFTIRCAYSGKDGLRAMRADQPDLVLLDLVMPGWDGFRVLEEMRQDPELANVPVILLTVTSYVEDMMRQRGGQLVIQRPGGLSIMETLRCLQAVIRVLEPRYDERSVPEEVLKPAL